MKLFIKLLFSVIRCHEVSAKNKIRKFAWQVRRVSSLLSATSRSTADLLETVLLDALDVVFHRNLPWKKSKFGIFKSF